MDRRWIYILIILIIGLTCLFYIAESSTTVGKATVKVSSFLFTVPDSFNIHNSGQTTDLINRKTNERIFVDDLGKGVDIKENMTSVIKWLNDEGTYSNVKNITLYDTIPTVYYEDSNGTLNEISYATKYNHTFYIKCTHFHDNTTMQKNTKYVADTLEPNYKQKPED